MAHDEETIDATRLLEEQHGEVKRLFEVILENPEDEAKVHELAVALVIHAKIEEQIFYPAMAEADDREEVLYAAEEHLAMKRTLADLLDTDAGDETFVPKLRVLKELVETHIEEEETRMFAEARRLFDEDVLAGLGQEMVAVAAELQQAEDPTDGLEAETDAAAPI